MRNYRYLHYDVFTDAPFEGNQLAVFPEPAGLSTEEMQTITREMNFSECTFIFPPEAPGTDVRMRILTPGEELPMAGHPTIGSTFALAKEGVIKPGQEGFVFGLGVGPTPVSLDWNSDALDFAWMTQKNPDEGGQVKDRAAFARAIGVEPGDLVDAPPQVVSCGVPFLFAALRSRAAVDSVSVDPRAYAAACNASGIDELPLFIFTTANGNAARSAAGSRSAADREADNAEAVYSRMLAPGFGITEDPATGGASGPLGCYLFKYRLIPRERLSHIVSLQGVKMRRPSRIHISIEATGEEITRVRVGGRSVLVGDGRLTF
jgi:trans-2,3-dihydro-3-hydroxyanthranilate isomerase